MRDVLLENQLNTQENKISTAAGQAQGLRVPSRTLPCPQTQTSQHEQRWSTGARVGDQAFTTRRQVHRTETEAHPLFDCKSTQTLWRSWKTTRCAQASSLSRKGL